METVAVLLVFAAAVAAGAPSGYISVPAHTSGQPGPGVTVTNHTGYDTIAYLATVSNPTHFRWSKTKNKKKKR